MPENKVSSQNALKAEQDAKTEWESVALITLQG